MSASASASTAQRPKTSSSSAELAELVDHGKDTNVSPDQQDRDGLGSAGDSRTGDLGPTGTDPIPPRTPHSVPKADTSDSASTSTHIYGHTHTHTNVHHHSSDPAEEAADLTSTILSTPAPAPPRLSDTYTYTSAIYPVTHPQRHDADEDGTAPTARTDKLAEGRGVPDAPDPKRIADNVEFSPAVPKMGMGNVLVRLTGREGSEGVEMGAGGHIGPGEAVDRRGDEKDQQAKVGVEEVGAELDNLHLSEHEGRVGAKRAGTAGMTGIEDGRVEGKGDEEGDATVRIKPRPLLDISEFDPLATPSHRNSNSNSNTNNGPTSHVAGSSLPRPAVASAHGSNTEPAKDAVSNHRSATAPPVPPKGTGSGSTSKAQQSLQRIEAQVHPTAAEGTAPEPSSADAESTQTDRDRDRGKEKEKEKEKEEPAFNFSGFLRDLRMKPAEPIARYLKSFLTNFAKKPFTVNEQIKLIHDFLRFINEKMLQYEPWKSQTQAELDNAMEAMEKLVMNRLYNYTFTPQLVPQQPITTDDLERDAVFAQRVRLFGWVQEKHLDVPTGEASTGFLGFAEQELLKINHYKAPRDKMICILNCCKVIFGLIRHTAGHSAGAEATSADAFVPILIFVVLKANPDNLWSNVEYINRFRSAEKLRGEAGYYLSSLSGAIAFIETMDATSLSSITVEEFESNVEQAVKDLPPSPTATAPGPGSRGFTVGQGGVGGSNRGSGSGNGPAGSSASDTSFAPLPGEEPARALLLPSLSKGSLGFNALHPPQGNTPSGHVEGASTPNRALAFLSRTGEAAAEAVSRPLGAIGKILEGIQDTGGSMSGSGSEDGDHDRDDERHSARRQQQQQQGQRQPPTPQNAHRLHRPRGMDRADRADRGQTPDFYWSESPVRTQGQQGPQSQGQQGQGQGQTQGMSPFRGQLYPDQRPPPPHGYQQQREGGEDESFNFSRAATPMHDGPAEELQHTLDASFETHAQSQAQAQTRSANVQTLQQMFPALDEEVLEAVLQGSEEDLGLAIDRLLEM